MFLETVLGLCLALAMNRAFRGRAFLRASILVPWAMPTAVSGLLWRWIFQSDGIANSLLGSEILWTAEGTASKLAVIIAEVWKTAPFIGLLVLAGMQIIPEEVYEAAKIDGAGWWRQLGSITLPLVKPTLLVAVLFRMLDALRMFDLPVRPHRARQGIRGNPLHARLGRIQPAPLRLRLRVRRRAVPVRRRRRDRVREGARRGRHRRKKAGLKKRKATRSQKAEATR